MTDAPIPQLEVLACAACFTHESPPSDLHEPRKSRCERCSAEIWIGVAAIAWLEANRAGYLMCVQCVHTLGTADECVSFEIEPPLEPRRS